MKSFRRPAHVWLLLLATIVVALLGPVLRYGLPPDAGWAKFLGEAAVAAFLFLATLLAPRWFAHRRRCRIAREEQLR